MPRTIHFYKNIEIHLVTQSYQVVIFHPHADQKQKWRGGGKVADPDPNWIRIQSGQWIRIRNPDLDPGGKNDPKRIEKN